MSLDISGALRDWPPEPGQIQVRRILGIDLKEKIQLRVDLGVLQMETAGRPDGERPHGCECLLAYYSGLAEVKTKQAPRGANPKNPQSQISNHQSPLSPPR